MNTLKLIARIRKIRTQYKLTYYEHALLLELIGICSEKNWKEVFQCSNFRLCCALQFSDKTLIKARRALVNAGLIYFSSGKCNREESSYSFTLPFQSEKPLKKNRATPDIIPVPVPDAILDVTPVPAPDVTPVPVPDVTPVPVPDVTPVPVPEYNVYRYINIPPLSPNVCERVRDPLLIPFDGIKNNLLADEIWKEQIAILSGLSMKFNTILPAQIDIFLRHIVAVGEENTIKTLSDAKRRFFWWWKNHGKNEYEKQTTSNQPIIW